MEREKATHDPDLPHPFDKGAQGFCTICKRGELHDLHAEKHRETADATTEAFPRETGT